MSDQTYWNPTIETQPREERERMQLVKLQAQLSSLERRSPFYRDKFAAAGVAASQVTTLADLEDFPFTTKEELRESQVASPPLGRHAGVGIADVIRVHSSSGTTGRPSYVGVTANDAETWTEVISRVYHCEGVRRDDVLIHGFGLGFFVGGLPLKDAVENLGATFVPIGTGASERLVTSIEDLGGTVLTCTPSYAAYLAEYVRERVGTDPRELGLRRILLGGEPGGAIPAVREQLAAEYGAHVTEGLGNADLIPVYAANCDELTGNHHLAPDHMLLELIDPDGGDTVEWSDGAEGELVATHLGRDCVPLVRFRVRDRVIVWTSQCPCGRTTPRITCVGRTDDMLIVAGVNVWPSAVKDVVAGLRPRTTGALQILLTEPGPRVEPPLQIQVEHGPGEQDLPALKAQIERELRERLIVRVDVTLLSPETLPRFEMKTQLIRELYHDAESP